MLTLTRPDGTPPEDLHISRRGIAAVFFTGYAVAALAANADPIKTDDAGLIIETVDLPSPDRTIPGYLARPKAKGRFPAVIVVSEIFGIHDYIKDICRRFAKLGYVAIAPAFFVRAGDPAPLSDMNAIMKIVATASDEQILGDVGGTLKFLKSAPYVEASKIAITGFCWGGKVTWISCETFPEIKSGVAWYGAMAPQLKGAVRPHVTWPILNVANLHAPVLGLYGGKDGLSAAVPAMREALSRAGKKDSEIVVYDDAGHGFHADYRSSYNKADAEDGWKRLLAHFKKNGVGPKAYRAG